MTTQADQPVSARRAGTRGAETVERALSVVIQILDDGGEANLRLAEVSRRSHVSIGSLYHHFPGGKDELAAAYLRGSGSSSRAQTVRFDVASVTGRDVEVIEEAF